MRIRINKTSLAPISVLVLTVSLCIMASPTAKASDVDTTATIVAIPDPIGVGQIITLIGDINPNPPTSPLGFRDIRMIFTEPDGSNFTLGPFISNAAGEVTLDYTPTKVGYHSVRFTFAGGTLSDGHYYQPCEAGTNFTVQQEPVWGPDASFAFDPTSPEVDETVIFDASGSSDIGGNIVSCEWDFGDQTTASGVTSTHAYSSEGIHIVMLIITDNDGIAGIATKIITVMPKPLPPDASFTFSPASTEVGQTATFDASNSSDPDGTIINYFWDFGDGTTGAGITATHSYTLDGTYTVTLTVTDNDALTDITIKTINDVIPEFPSWTILPLILTATLLILIYKQRLAKNR